MSKSKSPEQIVEYRNRIKEFKYVPAAKVVGNPKNWHSHGPEQTSLIRKVLGEVGFADALLVREQADGNYLLLDGHLRMGVIGDSGTVPALILDVSEAEGDKILASLDPLLLMADVEQIKADDLLAESLFDDPEIRAGLRNALALLETTEISLFAHVEPSPEPSLLEAAPVESYNPSFGFRVSVVVETPEARDSLIHLLEESGYTAEVSILR